MDLLTVELTRSRDGQPVRAFEASIELDGMNGHLRGLMAEQMKKAVGEKLADLAAGDPFNGFGSGPIEPREECFCRADLVRAVRESVAIRSLVDPELAAAIAEAATDAMLLRVGLGALVEEARAEIMGERT